MNKTIHIREAVTPEEVERFWQELHAYHARDVFPDPAEEDRAYFLDDSQYRAAVQRIHDREGDRCYYLLFRREGRDIGFALTALYPSEDGKCFVMEFCVLPEFRGGGTGTACARLLLDWAADRGAAADGGEHRAAAGRRGAGAYPLPAGIPGLPGRGDVLCGRELLHLLLRAGSGAGGSVRGAGIPETGHRPAADPQRSGTVP